MRNIRIFAGSALAAATICIAVSGPANALSMKECSTKYQAAKKDGSLAGEDWKSFRAKECASGTSSTAPLTTSAASGSAASSAAVAPIAMGTAGGTAPAVTKPSVAALSTGSATFPNAISQKYSTETAGKGRMHTCLDQYKVNKASNANGGLRWIQKGGGYYSECTKKLKGA